MRVTAGETHEASGHPWWQMSARYHLEALLPEFLDRPTQLREARASSIMRTSPRIFRSQPAFSAT